MPRQADHERRKKELTDATLALIDEQGIASVSVRNVAARAGWSVGALRYYFPQQENLVVAAAQSIHQEMVDGILAVADERWDDPVQHCIAMVESALPFDEDRRRMIRLIYCFIDLARFSPELSATMDHAWLMTRHACRLMIARLAGIEAPSQGQAFAEKLYEDCAAGLHVHWDGLCTHGLVATSLIGDYGLTPMATDLVYALKQQIDEFQAAPRD